MSHLFFIHSSFDGHLDCFHVSVVVKVLHRTSGCLYLCKLWFPLDVCPGEVLLGHMVALFLVFKNLLTVLHAGCSSLHSHQQFRRVLFSPHPFQPLIFVHFLIMVIWTGVRWYFTIVLIYISLIIRNVGHLFMCLLAICMSASEKCVFRSSAHFWIGLLFLFLFFILNFISCFYILEINPWRLITSFTNIFPCSVGCHFFVFGFLC